MVADAVVPPGPPSNVFGYRGTPPCAPGGGCAPCTLLGGNESFVGGPTLWLSTEGLWLGLRRYPARSAWRVQTPILTFPRVQGQGRSSC